jgi:hypothetical protein
MRIVIAVLMVVLCEGVIAASANWSGVSVMTGGNYYGDVANYSMGGVVRGRAEIHSEFFAHTEGEKLYMRHMDFSLEDIEPTFNWWAFAVYGDIVGEENFEAINRIEDFYDNNVYAGGTLVENPSDFYMVFKVSEVLVENHDYVPGQTWYGWVHASIDENLNMTLLGDGINLTGGAVTVGASPEPASGSLLLLGGALLALRRQRRKITP